MLEAFIAVQCNLYKKLASTVDNSSDQAEFAKVVKTFQESIECIKELCKESDNVNWDKQVQRQSRYERLKRDFAEMIANIKVKVTKVEVKADLNTLERQEQADGVK